MAVRHAERAAPASPSSIEKVVFRFLLLSEPHRRAVREYKAAMRGIRDVEKGKSDENIRTLTFKAYYAAVESANNSIRGVYPLPWPSLYPDAAGVSLYHDGVYRPRGPLSRHRYRKAREILFKELLLPGLGLTRVNQLPAPKQGPETAEQAAPITPKSLARAAYPAPAIDLRTFGFIEGIGQSHIRERLDANDRAKDELTIEIATTRASGKATLRMALSQLRRAYSHDREDKRLSKQGGELTFLLRIDRKYKGTPERYKRQAAAGLWSGGTFGAYSMVVNSVAPKNDVYLAVFSALYAACLAAMAKGLSRARVYRVKKRLVELTKRAEPEQLSLFPLEQKT